MHKQELGACRGKRIKSKDRGKGGSECSSFCFVRMGGASLSVFLFGLFVLLSCVSCDDYSIAIMSDMHIGESAYQTQLAQEAVAAINSKISLDDIRFVIITGDISNSALPEQMQGNRTKIRRYILHKSLL